MNDPFDDLRRYADALVSEVSPYTAERAVRSAMSSPSRRPRKALAVLVATGLMGVSNVALAATADPSAPGDTLYGVDRTYEQVADLVGLGGPRVSERLEETGVLVERGELAAALELVQETLGKVLESDDPEAELQNLVSELEGAPGAVSDLVLTDLVGLAHSVGRGDATGQDVAELARQLGQRLAEERSNRPDGIGPGGTPGGPPPDSPANSTPGATNPSTGGSRP